MSRLIFNKIYIIQSLSEEEPQTGEQLYNHINMLNTFHNDEIEVEFKIVTHKNELLYHIDTLTKEAIEKGIFPILQIDAHGASNGTGICLASGDFISWSEIQPTITNLNIATKCNLLLIMAACYGISTLLINHPQKRAAFWGLIAPTDKISPVEISSTLERFYESFYHDRTSEKIVNALTVSKLHLVTSEMLFIESFKSSIELLYSQERTERRIKKIKDSLSLNENMDFIDEKEIEACLKEAVMTEFTQNMNYFFMIDMYPENIDKVNIVYEDVYSK